MEGKKSSKEGHKQKSFVKKPNLEEIAALTEQKGLEKETTQKRTCVQSNFESFLKENDFKSLEQCCSPETLLEEFQIVLSAYFDCYTSKHGDKEELTKRAYADNIRSHLRMIIKEKSENRIDICDKMAMQKFSVSSF